MNHALEHRHTEVRLWNPLLIRWIEWEWVELVEPLWNLCGYFVPVWPYFVIHSNST
jgi:hypothetical protein